MPRRYKTLFVSGLFLLSGLLFLPSAAKAALLDTQIEAILNLLRSFGAEASVIANVSNNLHTVSNQGLGGNAAACAPFIHTLSFGSSDSGAGGEVSILQKILGTDSALYPENLITGYFGPATRLAVRRFQIKQGIAASGTESTTGYGRVGPATRSALYTWCVSKTASQAVTQTSTPPPSVGSFPVGGGGGSSSMLSDPGDGNPVTEDPDGTNDTEDPGNGTSYDPPPDNPSDTELQAFQKQLTFLSDKDRCQSEMITFAPGHGAATSSVFQLLDKRDGPPPYPLKEWHHAVNDCLDNMLSSAAADSSDYMYNLLYNEFLYELSRPEVRFYKSGSDTKLTFTEVMQSNGRIDTTKFDRVVFGNIYGKAYSGMTQVDMGRELLQAYNRLLQDRGARWAPGKMNDLKALGLATLKVITDPLSQGGLRNQHVCELKTEYTCSFYHSVTDPTRENTAEGGTLNKDLETIRDLATSANILENVDARLNNPGLDQADSAYFRTAATEGMNQMVYAIGNNAPGSPPNLMDYIPRNKITDSLNDRIQKSWLFYSINPVKQGAYYLDPKNTNLSGKHPDGGGGAYKNCNYDLYVISLLENDFKRLPGLDISGFTRPRKVLNNKSLLDFLLQTYATKLIGADGSVNTTNLYTADFSNARSKGGFFGACNEQATAPLPQETLNYLGSLHS